MAVINRTFRVFVSSTFGGLKAERDALQRDVFPRLRELCMRHGARFQAVDLRWGVSAEASLDQQTMTICLEEIARCRRISRRPNFLVLLGDRYGSRLLPAYIPADEFETITGLVAHHDAKRLKDWYLRDDNAVPAEYVLQPRVAPFDDPDTWKNVESELRDILLKGTQQLPVGTYDPMPYQASATEQEIVAGVLNVADAGEHVHCFFRTITNLDVLIQDVPRTDVVKDEEQRARTFVDWDDEQYLRDDTSERDLAALKKRLRDHLPRANIHDYQARWTGAGITTDHLSQLCADVYGSLAAIIEAELELEAQREPEDLEATTQEVFVAERTQYFTGRSSILHTIAAYLNDNAGYPLVISGASGSGKSSLLARAYQQACVDRPAETATVLIHFIGATPGPSDTRALLESLCHQIAQRYGSDESAIPTDLDGLVQSFARYLALATSQKPLFLFLDALDQLGTGERPADLSWLPITLPPNIRLVATCSTGPTLDAVERRLPPESFDVLEAMSEDEGEALLHVWLTDAGRRLTQTQNAEVLDKFAVNGLPLYLKLAFEEARRWRSYTPADRTSLAADIPGILHQLFARLAEPANHGASLVEHSLGFLGAAKSGLSEDELLDVLSDDRDVRADFHSRSPKSPPTTILAEANLRSPETPTKDRLPVVVWSRLYFDLQPYLAERAADGATLLTFYHRQLAEAVSELYLDGDVGVQRHRDLARYFAYQSPATGVQPSPDLLRSLAELPYQQTLGALWGDLFATLADFTFLELKAATGGSEGRNLVGGASQTFNGVYQLQEDFELAIRRWEIAERTRKPSGAYTSEDTASVSGHLAALRTLSRGLVRESPRITQQPQLLWQIMYNRLQWDAGVIRERLSLEESRRRTAGATPWLREMFPPYESPQLLQVFAPSVTLRGGTPWRPKIECCAVSPDGTLVVGGGSGALLVWDVNTGRQIASKEANGICYCGFAPDGGTLLSVGAAQRKGADGENGYYIELTTWDAGTWTATRTVSEPIKETSPRSFLRAAAQSSDGTRVVAAVNQMLLVWDVTARGLLLKRSVHEANIYCCAFSPDGMLFASGDERDTLLLWDTSTWIVRESFHCGLRGLFSPTVFCCGFSQDQQAIFAGGSGGVVRGWEIASGREVASFQHGEETGPDPTFVKACALSLEGQFLATAGSDHMLRVWDMVSGREITAFAGHNGSVNTCVWGPDDTHLISGGADGKVMVWDARPRGAGRANISPHTGDIKSCAISRDGTYFVTSSYDETARVWDLASGSTLHTLVGHTREVQSCAVHPDSATAFTGAVNGELAAWNARTGARLSWLGTSSTPQKSIGSDLAVSPDGRWLVSAASDRLQRWEITSGQWERDYEARAKFDDELRFCAISPDATHVASGGDDEALTVLDSRTGEVVRVLECHEQVRHLAYSPDGSFVVATTSPWHYLAGSVVMPDIPSDRALIVWDTDTWNQCHALTWHVTYITGCGVTADGAYIVAASNEGGIRVWDARTGDVQATYTTFHSLFCLALHPWKPVVVGGGAGGDMLAAELVGIALGPLILTAERTRERLELTCPLCHARQIVPTDLLGKSLGCSTAGCGAHLRLNAFTLATDRDPSMSLPPQSMPSVAVAQLGRKARRRFWPFRK